MIILGDTARAFEARSEQEIYELLEARSNNNRDVVIIEQETFEDRITYNVKVRPRVEAKIYVRKQSERNPNLHCEIIEFRELLIWLYWSKTRESDKDRPESYSGLLAE